MSFLAGKKSYIVASATLLYGVCGLIIGELDGNQAIQFGLTAAALFSVRSAIK